MSVGTVGCSWSSDCLGGGFSDSGIMPRTLAVPWKARTVALPALTAAARAMMPLAGVEERRGAAEARRRARVLSLATDLILMGGRKYSERLMSILWGYGGVEL